MTTTAQEPTPGNHSASHSTVEVTRRVLVAGAGSAVTLTALVACGGGGTTPLPSGASSGPSGTTTHGGPAPAPGALAKVADIPVGGAVSATDAAGKPVIVAQPSAGTVVAFSAICTHMGCTVAPAGGILRCPCHGSTYDLTTGDNTGGPAPSPLPEIAVTVQHGEVVEG